MLIYISLLIHLGLGDQVLLTFESLELIQVNNFHFDLMELTKFNGIVKLLGIGIFTYKIEGYFAHRSGQI